MFEISLNEKQLEIVRSALCVKSMKTLLHAQEVEKEEKEKGLNNDVSRIYYEQREEIKAIISRIDNMK
jgi:hypothetical protein